MNESMTPLIGVGIMVMDADGKVLLGYRVKLGEQASWCFPGGKVDAGESYETSAARELGEETGLNVSSDLLSAYVLLVHTAVKRVNATVGLCIQLKDVAADICIDVREPHIFEKWSWFSLEELPEHLFPETDAMLRVCKKEQLSMGWSVYLISSE